MSVPFEIKAVANEQMLANMAAELFIKHYRAALEKFAIDSFTLEGEAYKKVHDAWFMKLRSERTISVLESTAQQAIDVKIKEAAASIGKGKDYNEELIKQLTQIVFQQQQLSLEILVKEYFDREGPAWKIIEDQFKMKIGSQSLLRAIDAAINAHVENSANKKVFAFVMEADSLIHDQISPYVQDTLLSLIGGMDYKAIIARKFEEVIEKIVFEVALEKAKEGVGEVVHEEVMKRLPHSAVPFVGKVVDQLPYEAVLRHYVKQNAMPLMTDTLVKLSKNLLEKRFKPLIENQLDGLDPANIVMPEVVITGDDKQTVITITTPDQTNL